MRIKYKDYTYIDASSKDTRTYDYNDPNDRAIVEQYVYDENKYQELMTSGRHVDAYNYRKKYHSNNQFKDRHIQAQLNEYGQKARLHDAIYKKCVADGGDNKDAFEVANAWRTNGSFIGLENNSLVSKMRDAKRAFGSTNDKEATRISFSFPVEKRKIFKNVKNGFLSGDWLLRDASNTFDEFLNREGYSKDDLERAGVYIDKDEDGWDRITFDKSSPYSTALMTGILNYMPTKGDRFINADKNKIKYKSYDSEGNQIRNGRIFDPDDALKMTNFGVNLLINKNPALSTLKGIQNLTSDIANGDVFNSVKEAFNGQYRDRQRLDVIKDIIEESQKIYDDYFTAHFKPKQITSYDTQAIQNVGENHYKDWILDDILNGGTSTNYDIYTNTGVLDDNPTDRTLRKIDNQKQRTNLINLISGTDYKDLVVKIKSVDGIEGVAITRKPTEVSDNNKKKGTDYEDQFVNDEITVWIPGLIPNNDGDVASSDTHVVAMREANHMQMYDYDYTTSRNEHLVPTDNGFIYENEDGQSEITKEQAIAIITKDMIINNAKDEMYMNFVNPDGELINKDEYQSLAKQLAVRACNETYSNVPIINDDGSEMSVDEIFAMRGENDVADMYKNKFNYMQYAKLLDIYDIYIELMKGLSLYR